MKSKIIVGFLVLIGFGSCVQRPAKSKQSEQNTTNNKDSILINSMRNDTIPIRVMYGSPRPDFRPEKKRTNEVSPLRKIPVTEETPATE